MNFLYRKVPRLSKREKIFWQSPRSSKASIAMAVFLSCKVSFQLTGEIQQCFHSLLSYYQQNIRYNQRRFDRTIQIQRPPKVSRPRSSCSEVQCPEKQFSDIASLNNFHHLIPQDASVVLGATNLEYIASSGSESCF